jgi:hypothetical protein
MTNLLEQEINCDDGDRAAKIIANQANGAKDPFTLRSALTSDVAAMPLSGG